MAGAAQTFYWPCPDGGINVDRLYGRGELNECRFMENWIPHRGYLALRNGLVDWTTDVPDSHSWLHTYYGASGAQVVCCSDSKIYRAENGHALADLTGTTTPTSHAWIAAQIGTTMVLVNGADTPQQYNGTTVSDASYTGSGLTPANLKAVCLYRDRLYFVGANFDLWYGGSAAITGALTKVDLSSVFQRSGSLFAIGTWSTDDGGGLDDRLVLMSDQGEAVIYTGSYPGADEWCRMATYILPPPRAKRCFYNYGGELYYIGIGSLVPFSSLLVNATFTNLTAKLGDISTTENSNMIVDRSREFLYLNCGDAYVYVRNLETGAWGCFSPSPIAANDFSLALGDDGEIVLASSYNNFTNYRVSCFGGYSGTDHGTAFLATIYSGVSILGRDYERRKVTLAKTWFRLAGPITLYLDVRPDWRGSGALGHKHLTSANVDAGVIDFCSATFAPSTIGHMFDLYIAVNGAAYSDGNYYLGTMAQHVEAGPL